MHGDFELFELPVSELGFLDADLDPPFFFIAVFRIRMDPGIFADPDPVFTNPDPSVLLL